MPKVLIVEDEPYLAEMYKIKFEAEGFEVLSAGDGQLGFEAAKSGKPDLVFLDVVMPVMDGFRALALMKQDESTRGIPVVILSNLGQQEEVDKAISGGADGFLVKASLTPSELVAKAREILAVEGGSVTKAEILKSGAVACECAASNGKTVLLIEDNKDIIAIYRLQFQRSGFAMDLAENGAWGLKMAKGKKYDAIVMDMMMPAMNGYDMLKEIKESSCNGKTPVIVVSNSAQDRDIEEAMALGADKYFIKSSITPVELVREIELRIKIQDSGFKN